MFFLHKQGELASSLLEARDRADGRNNISIAESGHSREEARLFKSIPPSPSSNLGVYRDIGREVVELIRFLHLNGERERPDWVNLGLGYVVEVWTNYGLARQI